MIRRLIDRLLEHVPYAGPVIFGMRQWSRGLDPRPETELDYMA